MSNETPKKSLVPSPEAEQVQREVITNKKTKVKVRNGSFSIGCVYNDTLDWITDILQNEKNPKKVNSKCLAAVVLNGYFRLRLFYWLVWRWFYYIRQYTDEEMSGVISEIKKKVETQSLFYYVNTISLIDVRTTTMAMTMDEAERFRVELAGANRGRQQRAAKEGSSSPISLSRDDSSSDSLKSPSGDGGQD